MAAISSWDKVLLLTRFALEKKARDLVVLEVRELTSIADYFIICSGSSDRQVQSIAQGIEENSSEAGHSLLSVEGANRGHWVLMDFPTLSFTSSTSRCASSTISTGSGVTRLELSCPNLTQPWSISFKPRIIRYRSRRHRLIKYSGGTPCGAGISKERKAS